MGDQHDAPNQQVVRADGSGPWEEGTGGGGEPPEPESTVQAETRTTEIEDPPAEPAQQEKPPAKPQQRRGKREDQQP